MKIPLTPYPMVSRIFSCTTMGLDSSIIEVEVDLQTSALPQFTIVGLADTSIQESKERIIAAIKNSDIQLPFKKKIVNLAPADLRKQGPGFDLPIAVGILNAANQIKSPHPTSIFIGELALDGQIRPCTGILPIVAHASNHGFQEIYLPAQNAKEADLVKGITIFPLYSLSDLILHLRGEKEIPPFEGNGTYFDQDITTGIDMDEIKGQQHAKRALEIAAAGRHNLMLSGPPGAGKTMLARSFATIVPQLTLDQALEISKIYSVAGLLPVNKPLITTPPFRTVHHTTSTIALVGGGSIPKPGEISLAHQGILFLDEMPEFTQQALEALRQPLQDKQITITRAMRRLSFPADFILIAAKNPCPCGYAGDPKKSCQCTPVEINRYEKKISGPLLDRIDLHIEIPRVSYEKLEEKTSAENSREIRKRVLYARQIQIKRQNTTNNNLSTAHIKKFVSLNNEMQKLMHHAVDQFQLSPRMYFKIQKIARTIADLEHSEHVTESHLAEALQYRMKDRVSH